MCRPCRPLLPSLADLEVGDARVYLGIVLPVDGVAGLRRRHATASKYLADFGIANYCGFGRQQARTAHRRCGSTSERSALHD